MFSSFYTEKELIKLGLKSYGSNVKISRNVCIYNPEKIIIGNNVRIDDFSILSGSIMLGNHIHIAAFCGLWGSGGIILDDFCGLSSRVSIYSTSDSYNGDSLANPTIYEHYRNVKQGTVHLKKHVLIGASTVVLPGVSIPTGCAIGACSLINKNIDEWGIYAGIPVKRINERKKDILHLEKHFLREFEDAKIS